MAPTNLLFILADQWRSTALSCAAADPVSTPNLDALAAQGLRHTHGVSNYPVCSPYRAMMLTGQYPGKNGVMSNCNSASPPEMVGLREDSVCWSDVLASAGYATAYFGKWHLDIPEPADEFHGEGRRADGRVWDHWTPPGPRRHGFARWYAYGCNDEHLSPHYWVDDADREAGVDVDDWSARHETDVALHLLEQQSDAFRRDGTPFATVMSYNPPHPPFEQVPPEYLARVPQRECLLNRPNVDASTDEGQQASAVARAYFAAVSAVDEQIGRLLDMLDSTGVADDTLVVFTSDHGMQLGSHGLLAKNVWYDESLLVPLIFRLPGRVRTGTSDTLVSTPDLAPTMLALLGLDDRVPPQMQGRDLSALFTSGSGDDGPSAALYLRMPSSAGPEDLRGLRTRDRLLVAERRDGEVVPLHLYDCRADPFQRQDVLGSRPGEAAALHEQLLAELARVDDPWNAR